MDADARRCTARNKDGSPCKARANPGTGTCNFHSPAFQERAPQLRVLGGQAKARTRRAEKLLPSVLKPVLQQLLDSMPQIASGEMDPRAGSALAAVAGAVVRVFSAGEFEVRLAALEQAAKEPAKERMAR